MNTNYIVLGLGEYSKIAKKIASSLKIHYSEIETKKFADGEMIVTSKNSVRGKEVFLLNSTSNPVTDRLMETLIAIDSLKRASASKINVILPYFGYARQDRKAKSREPITAKLVANLLETAGADRITTFDLHSPQIEGFFDIPVDNLVSTSLIAEIIKKERIQSNNLVVVSPDHGGIVRARKLAKNLNTSIAVIDKRRDKPNQSEVMHILGDVANKNCILIDDMIDTGGTICNAINALKRLNVKKVYVATTHGVLSNNAIDKISALADKIFVSNSIIEVEDFKNKNVVIVDIYDFIKNVIKSVINHDSLGSVYEKYTKFEK